MMRGYNSDDLTSIAMTAFAKAKEVADLHEVAIVVLVVDGTEGFQMYHNLRPTMAVGALTRAAMAADRYTQQLHEVARSAEADAMVAAEAAKDEPS